MNAPVPHPPVVRTTCPYCGVGCGARHNRMAAAAPRSPAIPIIRRISAGCAPKAPRSAKRSGSTVACCIRCCGTPTARYARVDWHTALDAVADGFRHIIERDGPDAVAFYLSGQLLTEDYYVANKLMKGFIGSANVDTNSRLCMASSVAGHRRAFGADTVPGCYADLDEADLSCWSARTPPGAIRCCSSA